MSFFEYFVTLKKDLWSILNIHKLKKNICYLLKIRYILIESLSFFFIWTAYQK